MLPDRKAFMFKDYEALFRELHLIGIEDYLPAGSLLWREGEMGDEVALLVFGTMEVYHETSDGDFVVLRTLEPGAVIGELAAMDGQTRSATVKAATACEILRIPAEAFRKLLARRHDLLEELFWMQVHRVRSLTQQVTTTHHQAITDPLTGLYNFGFFRDRLGLELGRAAQTGDLVSLVIFDIDHFKHYNDTQGHQEGNEALVQVATIFRTVARRGDILARYGGEEFVVLLYGASREEAARFAEVVRQEIESANFRGGYKQPGGRFTISGGVANFPGDAKDENLLIEAADRNLYRAKESGRNAIFADSESDARVAGSPMPARLLGATRREAERLRLNHELILQTSGLGVQVIDPDGVITYCNPAAAAALGYEVSELLGTNHHSQLHNVFPTGETYPREECQIEHALERGDSHPGDEVLIRKDRSFAPVEYRVAPIRERGEFIGSVFAFFDIAERRALEEQLMKIRDEAEIRVDLRSEDLEAICRTVSESCSRALERLSSIEKELNPAEAKASGLLASIRSELTLALNTVANPDAREDLELSRTRVSMRSRR